MNFKTSAKAFAVVGALFVVAGCGVFTEADTKVDAPEPTPTNIINGTNTQVIQMPDGFRNVVFTCYGTDGVFVTSRGPYQAGLNADGLPSSIYVVPNDPHCAAR